MKTQEQIERNRETQRKYAASHPLVRQLSMQRWATANQERVMYKRSKSHAKLLGLDFTLELSDIVIPERCPYLGIELTRTYGKGRTQTNPSIDRIDSTKGYIKGNIQIVSTLANTMKQNATKEQLLAFANGIIKLHGDQN